MFKSVRKCYRQFKLDNYLIKYYDGYVVTQQTDGYKLTSNILNAILLRVNSHSDMRIIGHPDDVWRLTAIVLEVTLSVDIIRVHNKLPKGAWIISFKDKTLFYSIGMFERKCLNQ